MGFVSPAYSLDILLLLLSLASSGDVPDETISRQPIHPYFASALELRRPDADEVRVYVDGKLLPKYVSYGCDLGTAVDKGHESSPIAFVLVPPQDVKVDHIVFTIERPYYIATTEVSNAQYAQLYRPLGGVHEDYGAWAHDVYLHARLDMRVSGQVLDELQSYLAQPELPVLKMDLESAAIPSDTLSTHYEARFRLPTLAEWYAAMRGGKQSTYWWGDDVRGDLMAWRGNQPTGGSDFDFLRPVEEGPENPIGLYNCLGNAAELVFPSEEERRVLRTYYGPNAAAARTEKYATPGFGISPLSAFALGGSVETGWRVSKSQETPSKWKEGFARHTSELPEIILWHQILDNPGWNWTIYWCTGVRFVLEAPEGTVVVERGEPRR
jgi:formylglycine-generating enzyme required for sulfatase activity